MITKVQKLSNGQLYITNLRGSYLKLFKAEAVKGDSNSKPRFGGAFLIPKDQTEAIETLQAEILAVGKDSFKLTKILPGQSPLKDGDASGKDGYEGTVFLSANRAEKQGRPNVVDRKKNKLAADDDGVPYSGCYVNIVVSLYGTDVGGKKVCAALETVQFVKDGEPLGGGGSRANLDEIPDIEDDEEDGL